jgi:TolB protein
VPASGGLPVALGDDATYVHSIAWANITVGKPRATLPAAPLYPPPSIQTPAALIPLRDVYLAPSYGRISDRVSGSFQALRARVKAEAGWDFLSALSDMARQLVGPCGDGCDVMSWHKTGRAIDTRLTVESGGVSRIEVVREDQLGETYWRVYLRAAKQDGMQGEPLTQAPWDWTNTARWTLAPHQGGVTKPIPDGYYVDFTELAREYGWERISSYDDETFSWKEDKAGMEFWHYQSTNGTTWYAALEKLYGSQTLAATFDWNELQRQGEEAYRVRLKEVPAPPSAWRWFALFP